MEIGIIGTSVWQQNLPLVAKLTIDREQRALELNRLKTRLGLKELIYLSTCNRVEFIFVSEKGQSSAGLLHHLLDFFFSDGRDISFFPNDFYQYNGKDAVNHLFRITSSLESLAVGETQITGQFSEAWDTSKEIGICGPALDALAGDALRVARRVRRETKIGDGAVSMASLAVKSLRAELSDRKLPRIAIVGTGPMASKCAAHILEGAPCELIFVSRTAAKAAALADRFDGSTCSLNDFLQDPGNIDAIFTATAAQGEVFGPDFLARIDKTAKPMVCIDLAMPRDFSDEFAGSDKVVLVDIAELRAREQKSLRKRFVKVGQAGEIVEEEVENFFANRIEVSLKPIFHKAYSESVTMAEKAFSDLFERHVTTLGDEDQQAILRLVNKLLGHSCFQPAKELSDHLANRAEYILPDEVVARESA